MKSNISGLGMFNLPNLLTAANLLSGCVAIILALSGRIDLAPFAIFAGLLFDFLDGFLARKMKIAGELGKQLDSLADMVTFGLAPGVIMMVVMISSIYMDSLTLAEQFPSYVHQELHLWVNAVFYGVPNDMDASIKYLPFAALFIPFMSMFRLAKFNIDTRQSDSFIGVPTPLNTLFFMFFPLCMGMYFEDWKNTESIYQQLFNTYFLLGFVLLMPVFLVAELPLFSLKFKHFRWEKNEIRFIFLGACLIFIPFLHVWSIPLIVFLYMNLSLLNNRNNKKEHHEI